MIKIYCDACGKEDSGKKFDGPCHLLDEKFRDKLGYIDDSGNSISGRNVTFDVCNKCWNEIYSNKIYTVKYNDIYAIIPLEIIETTDKFNIKCLSLYKVSENTYVINKGRMGTRAGGGTFTGESFTDINNLNIYYELNESAKYIENYTFDVNIT